jgi:hypothetical protein
VIVGTCVAFAGYGNLKKIKIFKHDRDALTAFTQGIVGYIFCV